MVRIEVFASLLERWNTRINLVGRGDADAIRPRHVADSLQVLALMPAGATSAVDLGSGSGLPGLVLAVAGGVHVHLVDRDQRKAAFLREAIRVCEAKATVHVADFLELPPVGADVVLSRATAPLAVLLDAGRRHGRNGAVMLFHKSAAQFPEAEAARARHRFALQRLPSRSDPRGEIWRVSGVRHGA
jgi:16S rRNA (guanine527-N7)-methyltransferase